MPTSVAEQSSSGSEPQERDLAFDITPSMAIYAPYYLTHGALLAVIVFLTYRMMLFLPAHAHAVMWAGLAASLLAIGSIVGRALQVNFTRYVLDAKRLTMQFGIIGRGITSIELFRIQDVNFEQTWWHGLFGIGTLVILTSDPYHPQAILVGVRDGARLREQVTDAATAIRMKAGVHEITVGQ